MDEFQITITEDQALVLFEFFARFEDKERLYFVHPAEYLALMKIAGQIDKTTSAMFKTSYGELLKEAKDRIAGGFESDFPEIEKE